MAHTDRDDERWARHNHDNLPCIYNDRDALPFVNSHLPVHAIYCETCERLWSKDKIRLCISFNAKSDWNRSMRREERSAYRQAMQQLRTGHVDVDEIVFNYRRPYFD